MPLYLYFSPLVLFLAGSWLWHRRGQQKSVNVLREATESGLMEPSSLHPVIDRNKCIGCKSCVYVCPQQLGHKVLGIYHGKAELLEPANCIGHGACKTVCPAGAITLVFGTENRGMDIPQVDEQFQTNVPGIYIAGELGGMGLIRNSIEQGKAAVKSIAATVPKKSANSYNVMIIGAGPAGIAATLAAQEKKLKYLAVDQESLGGTVYMYPRGKIVMTQPVELPLYGTMSFKETSKEKLLEFWQKVVEETGIKISYGEIVAGIDPSENGFTVKTNKGEYTTDTVLLAIGRRGTPRKLNVPGEDLSKVVYRLIDPSQYINQSVLIVGGGDSALEAALSIADEEGSKVSLSYRSDSFSRAKAKNRDLIDQYSREGKIKLYLPSTVSKIEPGHVTLSSNDENIDVPNDAVIVNAGGILPNGFLKEIGVQIDTKHGTE